MTDAPDPATADSGQDPSPAILLAAFEGWNDAGSSASQVVAMIEEAWEGESIHELDPQDYHDFQVNRPISIHDEDGTRLLNWPTTTISVVRTPVAGRTVLLVQGIEPSFRWLDFCEEILDVAQEWGVSSLVSIGALLADVPHTRPVPCQVTSDDPAVQALLDVDIRRCVAIEDSIPGVASAEASGAATIAVPLMVDIPPAPGRTLLPSLAGVTVADLSRVAAAHLDTH